MQDWEGVCDTSFPNPGTVLRECAACRARPLSVQAFSMNRAPNKVAWHLFCPLAPFLPPMLGPGWYIAEHEICTNRQANEATQAESKRPDNALDEKAEH